MYSKWEAAQISWSCYQKYRTSEDVKKAVTVRQSLLEEVKLASTKKIWDWIDDVKERLKLMFKNIGEDVNLLKQLDKLDLKENGWVFNIYY